MNALRHSLSRTAENFMTRRCASGWYKPKSVDFTNMERQVWNLRRDWFSDPSTYPLIAVMGCASLLLAGGVTNALIRSKDLRFSPKKRNSTLRTWGTEERDGKYHHTLEYLVSWNAYGKEGLGVDHEQWLKEKEATRIHEEWLAGGRKEPH